ncbi:MAG TPA: RNA polymerase sigma factor [Acidimicrobiia bacterium]
MSGASCSISCTGSASFDQPRNKLTSEDGHELDDLVDGIRRRSDPAFRSLYQATADGLASYAFGMLGQRAAAEDAVQQAFLELVRAAATFRGDGRALRVWLYRSVRFTCLDEIRRRTRRREELTKDLPERPQPEAAELDVNIGTALDGLTERQRSLILLRHVVGLTPEEIARVSRVHRSAIYAALGRAERRLRSLLDERTPVDEEWRR